MNKSRAFLALGVLSAFSFNVEAQAEVPVVREGETVILSGAPSKGAPQPVNSKQPVTTSKPEQDTTPEQDITWELYQQIETLRQEITRIRGVMEQQSHRISVLEQQQRQWYLDLDSRLSALKENSDDYSSGSALSPGSALKSIAPSIEPSIEPKPEVSSSEPFDQQTLEQFDQQKTLYQKAQSLLKDKKLSEAETTFQQVVQKDSDSPLSANAWYWIGEINLALSPPNYEKAQAAFNQVVARFPDHGKTPSVLYKLALIEMRNGQEKKARALLNQVVKDYPDSSPAKLAQDQLNRMDKP